MRPLILQEPFTAKLMQLQEQLRELTQFAAEGFDISKIEKETKEQIERLRRVINGKE